MHGAEAGGAVASEVFLQNRGGKARQIHHHQAIHDLGRGLLVTASAADGVVEAVELPSARFVLAVQWHPEEGMDRRPFDALVRAARAYMEERSIRTGAGAGAGA